MTLLATGNDPGVLSSHVMVMAFWQPCNLTQTHVSHSLAQGSHAEDKPRKSPSSLRSICVSNHVAGSLHGVASLYQVREGRVEWRGSGHGAELALWGHIFGEHHWQDFLTQPNQLPPVCLGKGHM